MKSVKLKGRKIVASCRYCGSDDVQLDRSPVWQNGEWMIPNIVTYRHCEVKIKKVIKEEYLL